MKIIQKKYCGLLNILLFLWTIVQMFSIIQKLFFIAYTPMVPVFLLLDIVMLIGLVLLFQLKKRGFYLIVEVSSIRLFLSFILPFEMEMYALKSIFSLGLFLLLMRVKCKETGLNGYQALGITCKDNKKAEYKDKIFLENALTDDAYDNSREDYVVQNNVQKETPKAEPSNDSCQEGIMVNENRRIGKAIKDFIDNWQINVSNESAIHISGLGFRHIAKGVDGREKIEISNWPQWARSFIDKGNTIEQSEKMQNRLYNEFVDIYKQVIIPRKRIMTISAENHTK